MRVCALLLDLAALLFAGATACSCMPGVTLTDHFLSDSCETIGVFCNGVPSCAFPDVDNQSENIEWKLKVESIYKGDCSLAPAGIYAKDTFVTVESGPNDRLCGVDLSDGCYVLGITTTGVVELCGPYIKAENVTPELSAELETNNQCLSGTPTKPRDSDCK